MLHNISILVAVWFFAMAVVNAARSNIYLAVWCLAVFMIAGLTALAS